MFSNVLRREALSARAIAAISSESLKAVLVGMGASLSSSSHSQGRMAGNPPDTHSPLHSVTDSTNMGAGADMQENFVTISTLFLGVPVNGGWSAPYLLHGKGAGLRDAGVLAQRL
jgi:hypothetical protein